MTLSNKYTIKNLICCANGRPRLQTPPVLSWNICDNDEFVQTRIGCEQQRRDWELSWHGLSKAAIAFNALLDSQQHGCVPLIQPRDAVVVSDGICEAVNVLLLASSYQRLRHRKTENNTSTIRRHQIKICTAPINART